VGKGEETRQAILGRALELATSLGVEGLTIGRLADDVQLSKSGLFAHFGSKEALQIQVIGLARELFTETVVLPAIRAPRGEPRVRALFDRWMRWAERPGGCPIVQFAAELDDRPGPAREALVQAQKAWLDTLAKAARIAADEGHFRKNLDVVQFAFELVGIMLSANLVTRLLEDPMSRKRAKRAFDGLLERSR